MKQPANLYRLYQLQAGGVGGAGLYLAFCLGYPIRFQIVPALLCIGLGVLGGLVLNLLHRFCWNIFSFYRSWIMFMLLVLFPPFVIHEPEVLAFCYGYLFALSWESRCRGLSDL